MFERFTDRARKVLQLARQEAVRLGHGYLSITHLLAGLVKENSGVACTVLRNLGVDPLRVLAEARSSLDPDPDPGQAAVGWNPPPTPGARRLLERAGEEARELRQDYVGTEHLLLSLLRDDGPVRQLLTLKLGVERDAVLHELQSCLCKPPEDGPEVMKDCFTITLPDGARAEVPWKTNFTVSTHGVSAENERQRCLAIVRAEMEARKADRDWHGACTWLKVIKRIEGGEPC